MPLLQCRCIMMLLDRLRLHLLGCGLMTAALLRGGPCSCGSSCCCACLDPGPCSLLPALLQVQGQAYALCLNRCRQRRRLRRQLEDWRNIFDHGFNAGGGWGRCQQAACLVG